MEQNGRFRGIWQIKSRCRGEKASTRFGQQLISTISLYWVERKHNDIEEVAQRRNPAVPKSIRNREAELKAPSALPFVGAPPEITSRLAN